MSIDYPTQESREKFNQRKQRGEIPAHARIGGSIGIHGTWPHEDFVIDRYKNWTEGCISMKNEDVKEIYAFTRPGARKVRGALSMRVCDIQFHSRLSVATAACNTLSGVQRSMGLTSESLPRLITAKRSHMPNNSGKYELTISTALFCAAQAAIVS